MDISGKLRESRSRHLLSCSEQAAKQVRTFMAAQAITPERLKTEVAKGFVQIEHGQTIKVNSEEEFLNLARENRR